MSKIGRKPIAINNLKIELNGNEVRFSGKKDSGNYIIPKPLTVSVDGNFLKISCMERSSENNRIWGLHRALLANKINGAVDGFSEKVLITGLGFKAIITGQEATFSLGYSHKIQLPLPQGVTVDVDKTGQNLVIKGSNREAVGQFCSEIRSLRPPEPYKGTGITVGGEKIHRKVGKKKS
jgi:large subunit ribosomal protein L6